MPTFKVQGQVYQQVGKLWSAQEQLEKLLAITDHQAQTQHWQEVAKATSLTLSSRDVQLSQSTSVPLNMHHPNSLIECICADRIPVWITPETVTMLLRFLKQLAPLLGRNIADDCDPSQTDRPRLSQKHTEV